MSDENIKEKKLTELILKGNRYEGIFLAEEKIGKIKLKDKFPAIWIHQYYWDGKGIIKDRETGEEREIFLDTFDNNNQRELKDNIIYFDTYLAKQKIIDYATVIDLQLQIMYKKAKKRGNKKITIHPEPFKVAELIKKGLVEENAKEKNR